MNKLVEEGMPVSVGLASVVTWSHPNLQTVADDHLVTFMALKDDDPDRAMRACEELHARHARMMIGWFIQHRHETRGQSAEDFVNTTFLRAYERTDPFVCPTDADADERRRLVGAWLFSIARRLFYDDYAAEKKWINAAASEFSSTEKRNGEPIPAEATLIEVSSQRRELAERFIDTCDPVDQEILRATAEHWCAAEAQTVIPDEDRDALCRALGLSLVSLRVRRMRLLKRMRDFILEHHQTHH